ncbi:hypothetical protein [Parasporobacterium paucivorans]|uniref:DUF4352 domain-containing protein n=1 Tax=Parasporobacterium paucivorans DSM 15970 TaxID=1122934 RepID=A0A1M6KNS7_9FIRM|nr:hypothetical protein [Parasporobacterium paucivorans]SHJ60663.1 hypothetical protein SAMN02745691_02236 [Parasporobacterium paucivorans DSM 15970]
MNVRLKKIIFISAAFILAISIGIKVYTINSKYPQPEIVEYNQGRLIKGGELTIRVARSRIMELSPDYNQNVTDPKGVSVNKNDIKVLLLDIDIVNTSDEDKQMSMINFVAQSQAWSNGWDMDLYSILNNTEYTNISIEANQSETIQLPFLMYRHQFKEKSWNDIGKRQFDLILTSYPVKNIVKLKVEKSKTEAG